MDAQLLSKTLPFEITNLFHIADRQNEIPWSGYKKGVEIFRIYGDGITGPTAALLRYSEAGEVPMHEHSGYEHIFVLSGSQEDENGTFNAGSMVINPPGTRHKVRSDAGCIVLAIYEKPVRFLEVSE
jgi:anti-sigma factor ChrR (cupin superfamily)